MSSCREKFPKSRTTPTKHICAVVESTAGTMTRKQHYMSWILWTAFSLQVVRMSGERPALVIAKGELLVGKNKNVICYIISKLNNSEGLFPLTWTSGSKPGVILKASESTNVIGSTDFRSYVSTITINVTREMNLDSFICTASLANMSESVSWTVKVTKGPDVPVITGPTEVTAGDNVTWICRVSGYTIKPEVFWQSSDGTQLQTGVNDLNDSDTNDTASAGHEVATSLTMNIPVGRKTLILVCLTTWASNGSVERLYKKINVSVTDKGPNECNSRPCQHNASCYASDRRYRCACPAYYLGTDCEVVIPSDPQTNCSEYLAEGTASITCDCYIERDGAPQQARVGWTSSPVPNNNRSLTLTDIYRDTKGTFRCELQWIAPVHLRRSVYHRYLDYEVKVAWGPSAEDVSINGPAYILVDDVPLVRVVCNWTDVNPDPEITWSGVTCDGDHPGPVCSFTPDPSFPKLLNVTCKVTNRFLPGKEVSVTHSISVKTLGLAKVRSFKANGYTDSFLLTADDRLKPITLECLAMGDPLPEVRVYKILNYTHGIKMELSENSSQNIDNENSIAKNYTIAAPLGCDSVANEWYNCDVRNNRSSNSSVMIVTLLCPKPRRPGQAKVPTLQGATILKVTGRSEANSINVMIIGFSMSGTVLLALVIATTAHFRRLFTLHRAGQRAQREHEQAVQEHLVYLDMGDIESSASGPQTQGTPSTSQHEQALQPGESKDGIVFKTTLGSALTLTSTSKRSHYLSSTSASTFEEFFL